MYGKIMRIQQIYANSCRGEGDFDDQKIVVCRRLLRKLGVADRIRYSLEKYGYGRAA